MGMRHPNPRQVKIHRPYSTEELASALKVHKNTVRRWSKEGLHPIDEHRPLLFRGKDVVAFLETRRAGNKRSCGPGKIYCFKCRSPTIPDGLIADLNITGPSMGCHVGICPVCATMLYRRVNPTRPEAFRGNLEITVRKSQQRNVD
jgi:Helix-turn-helix domain